MSCYHPVPAFQGKAGEPIKLNPPIGSENLQIRCGKCLGCRTDHATGWARRCEHEASLWAPHNHFVTLTYDDEHLPPEGHLSKEDLRNFIKRLRKHAHGNRRSPDGSKRRPIRYFACGEYGETTGRPHYHIILFNLRLNDLKKESTDLYSSRFLTDRWTLGGVRIAPFTGATANYIAQYHLKKIGQGNYDADGVYRPAPKLWMSLKPSIGALWADKYTNDLQHGFMVTEGGRKNAIPRYYTERIKKADPQLLDNLRWRQQQQRTDNPTDAHTPERRKDAEIIHTQRKQNQERARKNRTNL